MGKLVSILNAILSGSYAVLFEEHAVEGLATAKSRHETDFLSCLFGFCAQQAFSFCQSERIEQGAEIVVRVELYYSCNVACVDIELFGQLLSCEVGVSIEFRFLQSVIDFSVELLTTLGIYAVAIGGVRHTRGMSKRLMVNGRVGLDFPRFLDALETLGFLDACFMHRVVFLRNVLRLYRGPYI